MIKILSIGNSFSRDAQKYLHRIAAMDGMEILTYNMYISGCYFERHWNNYLSDSDEYIFEKNGNSVGCTDHSSISNALKFENWDIITIQQGSARSGLEDTYSPYMENLIEVIRKTNPSAEIYLHETWEYEKNSPRLPNTKYSDNDDMYLHLRDAYKKAALKNGLKLIPTGDVIHILNKTDEFSAEKGGQSLYRDSFHLHLNYGRYLAAAVWYEVLCGGNILKNELMPAEDGESDPKLIKIIKNTVHEYLKDYKNEI